MRLTKWLRPTDSVRTAEQQRDRRVVLVTVLLAGALMIAIALFAFTSQSAGPEVSALATADGGSQGEADSSLEAADGQGAATNIQISEQQALKRYAL